jgi:hypothetical protein
MMALVQVLRPEPEPPLKTVEAASQRPAP